MNLNINNYDIVIVGAGFYGATIAERVANGLQKRVLLLDRRQHFGGNAYSEFDSSTGIEVHKYGAHLFHTSNEVVWSYINQFGGFNNYQHRVRTLYRGQTYPIPINLDTICSFFGKSLSPDEARALITSQAAELGSKIPSNLEEKAISMIGRPLYEAFIKGYTVKQWQTDPRELPESIINRLPVRYDYYDRYFTDRFEGLPVEGYARIFERMLRSPLIDVRLGLDYFDIRSQMPSGFPLVYTGPIDRYFNYREGQLGWRTIDFAKETLEVENFQGAPVINYADLDVPFTRILEFKHLHPERSYRSGKTVIVREFPRFARTGDEPYYPIGTLHDKKIYLRYKALAETEKSVHFGGRLGTYRYLDMHQAIAAALHAFETEISSMMQVGLH